METLKVNIPSSFVKKELKFKNEKGSGEAKLFIGSTGKSKEFDEFFYGFSESNNYLIQKEDLIDYLKRTELEYIAHKCGEYKEADREYYEKVLSHIKKLENRISFKLVKFTDKSRYYIRTEGEYKWVFDLIREIALPKITDLVIEKQEDNFIFSLKINFENVCKRENEESEKIVEEPLEREKIDKPHQRIFFGAPGTGKSYKLKQEAEEYFKDTHSRVTFHPNYMFGNFVGSFKPFLRVLKDKNTGKDLTDEYGNTQETITYEYVPGPLMRILVEALKHKNRNYLLLIEEINRANVAAVFGDFFQLLDRKNGESEYPISTSKEQRKYFKDEFSEELNEIIEYVKSKLGENYERIVLPENLYIWATMNSADQGVMPMDTAFKRRWEFKYIGIDDALKDSNIENKFENYRFKISKDDVVRWNDFRVEVNKRLLECNVPEDKLMGPYFISEHILESSNVEKLAEVIKNKVLMYLYDDAGKPHRKRLFSVDAGKTYSKLCEAFDKDGRTIFSQKLELISVGKTESPNDSSNFKKTERIKVNNNDEILNSVGGVAEDKNDSYR